MRDTLTIESACKMLAHIAKRQKNQFCESKALELLISSLLKEDCTKLREEEIVKSLIDLLKKT